MNLGALEKQIGKVEREATPPRDRIGRALELVALARLRTNGQDERGLSLKTEAELLAIIGCPSREAFTAELPALRAALAREMEKRSLEPSRT